MDQGDALLTSLKMQVLRRIDYHFATPKLAALAKKAAIYKGQKFSGHAPLTIDSDLSL